MCWGGGLSGFRLPPAPPTLRGYSARPARTRGNKQMGPAVPRGPQRAGRETCPGTRGAGSRGPRPAAPRPRPGPYRRSAAEDEAATQGGSSEPGARLWRRRSCGARAWRRPGPGGFTLGEGVGDPRPAWRGPGVRGPGTPTVHAPARQPKKEGSERARVPRSSGGCRPSHRLPRPPSPNPAAAPLPPRKLWRRSSTVSSDWLSVCVT